jgi:hypothetical protein
MGFDWLFPRAIGLGQEDKWWLPGAQSPGEYYLTSTSLFIFDHERSRNNEYGILWILERAWVTLTRKLRTPKRCA